ncbi:MAG: carboxypeptidase-like regulatory domain-containing protein [Bacteroidota bacterium]
MKLTIHKPCTENFDQFSPTEKGGFCQACQKEVIDFSQMSDAEILSYFKNREGKSCGYFHTSQLKVYPEIASPKRTWGAKFMGASLLGLSLFASFPQAQGQSSSEVSTMAIRPYLGEEGSAKKDQTKEGQLVAGVVVNDEGEPLEGASVLIKGTTNGMFTNEKGEFKLYDVKEGGVLIASYVGYRRVEYKISKMEVDKLKIEMDFKMKLTLDSCVMMGEVAVEQAYSSKKSLWQRVTGIFR